jgi:hypothetical protein
VTARILEVVTDGLDTRRDGELPAEMVCEPQPSISR